MTTRIAILDDYQNAALDAADWDSLGAAAEVTVFNTYIEGEAAVAETLQDFDVVIGMRERTPFPKSLIDALPNLKLLVTTGMRNLSFDMDAARDRGVVVSGTAMLGYPASEHAVALMMALFKKIPLENQVMHEGGWQGDVSEGMNGKTLGILGLGKLGAKVAKVGLALDMDVIAWSENLTRERCEEVGVSYVHKDALYAESDVLSIHQVLSDRTRGMIGTPELTLMKSTAYLINTSRGPIVDEAALVEALANNTIAGAGIDVYDVEPLPENHPIRSLDNAILTGHTGYVVKELYALAYGEALENVKAWIAGEPVRVLNAE
ncbi:MAG: D-2-hydroxyacid dehydrogenase family protein [Rhodospirillales bacterium]|nr:D-2-hydroxyacid dehydrogenase family protein [Alphaproteobacteria bacterium]MBL6947337.1 D-2-hydroxyacid dehydrogenase family protein [Rhodospirillales bacterium]